MTVILKVNPIQTGLSQRGSQKLRVGKGHTKKAYVGVREMKHGKRV